MKRTNSQAPRVAPAPFLLLAIFLAGVGTAPPARAQDEIRIQQDAAIDRVQAAVRERIISEQGGRSPVVIFNNDAQRFDLSSTQTGVRGTGVYRRNNNRERRFSYEAAFHNRRYRVENLKYSFEDNDNDTGDRDRVPDWLRGTFNGRNPRSRRPMTLTINRRGDVVARTEDGAVDRGAYADSVIRFGGAMTWRVTRADDGFEARDESLTRRRERFRRVSPGGGEDDGRIPVWAVGVFRGTTDSGESELVIGPDGTATARSITRGRVFTGSYDGDVLRFEFGSYNIERDGDGIRTVEIGNRSNRTSYRRVRNQ